MITHAQTHRRLIDDGRVRAFICSSHFGHATIPRIFCNQSSPDVFSGVPNFDSATIDTLDSDKRVFSDFRAHSAILMIYVFPTAGVCIAIGY